MPGSLCNTCGYDLSGLSKTDSNGRIGLPERCPECGCIDPTKRVTHLLAATPWQAVAIGLTPVVLGWLFAAANDGMVQVMMIVVGSPLTGALGGVMAIMARTGAGPHGQPSPGKHWETAGKTLIASLGLAAIAAVGAGIIFAVIPGKWSC